MRDKEEIGSRRRPGRTNSNDRLVQRRHRFCRDKLDAVPQALQFGPSTERLLLAFRLWISNTGIVIVRRKAPLSTFGGLVLDCIEAEFARIHSFYNICRAVKYLSTLHWSKLKNTCSTSTIFFAKKCISAIRQNWLSSLSTFRKMLFFRNN